MADLGTYSVATSAITRTSSSILCQAAKQQWNVHLAVSENQNQEKPLFAIKLTGDLHVFAMNSLPMAFPQVFARQRRRGGRKWGIRSQVGTFWPMRTRKIPL